MFHKFSQNIPRRSIPTRPKVEATNQVCRKEVYESVTQIVEESHQVPHYDKSELIETPRAKQ